MNRCKQQCFMNDMHYGLSFSPHAFPFRHTPFVTNMPFVTAFSHFTFSSSPSKSR